MKLKFLPLAAATLLTACTAAAAGDDYKVTVTLPQSANGATAFIVDYDNGAKLDSVMVENGKALFSGKIDKPVLARIVVDGNRVGNFILESGDISFGRNTPVKGGALNASLDKAMAGVETFQKKAQALPQDSTYQAGMEQLSGEYDAYMDSVIRANADNPVGYLFFLQQAYELDLPALRETLEKYPSMKGYSRTAKLLAALEQKEKTQPGNKFLDFTIKNDTVSQSLSDYVGKGRYTLVDFWASWCGPCIRQTEVLKKIYNKYGRDVLDVLGVAVWDDPDATLKAVKDHELPWESILNAQTIPTDLYGITGIPCIILFGPDGTILSRGKQSEELIADVDRELAKTQIAPSSTNKTEGAPFSR